MAKKQSCFVAAMAATMTLFLCAVEISALAQDRPNRMTPSDIAAGQWMDSLLDPDMQPALRSRGKRSPEQRSVANRRSNVRGRLVKNPDVRDGSPAFALVDRRGDVLRFVEPVDSINLENYLGKAVSVRRDTGNILLASQLALPRTGKATSRAGVQQAQNLEPIPAGEPVPADEPLPAKAAPKKAGVVHEGHHPPAENQGPIYIDEGYDAGYGGGGYEEEYVGGYDDGLDFGGCPDCGSYVCRQFGGCGPGSRGRAYVRGEYLLWWFDGMDTPALVTQSAPVDGGVLPNPGIPNDNPSTVILFGGKDLLDDSRDGARILFGVWIDDAGRQGLEFDYVTFGDETDTFSAGGEDGNPTISRPFFDLFPDDDDNGVIDIPPGGPSEAAEQVSSDTLDGTVTVRLNSEFDSFGVRFRHNLCCCTDCDPCCGDCAGGCGVGIGCGSGVGCGSGIGWGGGTRRVDLLTGFRYARLDEFLGVREDLTVDAGDATGPIDPNIPPDGTQFIVNDLFETENEFVGGEIGFLWEIEQRRWSLELLSRLAIGSTRQRARIAGSTEVITDPPTVPAPDPSVGGLLAQSSNIGSYERDEFSVMPEIGFTVGYRMTPRFKLTAGYTLLYWTNVLRPGDQIDREINGTLIPDFDDTGAPIAPGPLVGPLRPEFQFRNTNLWAQGVNLGGELRW